MCRMVCCRAWRWNWRAAGVSLAAHCCCCRGGKTHDQPDQLASSPATLSVMGKGDKRGHAQRADGKSTLDRSQDKTPRSVKFTFHTHGMSRNSSVGIATGYGLNGKGSIFGRSKIVLLFIASRLALQPTTLLSNGCRRYSAQSLKLTTQLHLVPRSRLVYL
jgi:hypothetical protein